MQGAKAIAHYTVYGQKYTLVGNGMFSVISPVPPAHFRPAYHDSNFGQKDLAEIVNQWYWGRGIVGPYTFVYFAYLPKGTTLNQTDPNAWYTVGYLSQNNATLAEFCSAEQDAARLAIETRGDIWSQGQLSGFPDGSTQGIALTYTVGSKEYKFNLTS